MDEKREESLHEIPGYENLDERTKIMLRMAYVLGARDEDEVFEEEPKTGHWIGIDEEPHEDYECDKCGYTISTYTANIEPHTEYKYCPNCGAKMVEPQESEGKGCR